MEVYQGMMTYPNVAKPVIIEMESHSEMARSVGSDQMFERRKFWEAHRVMREREYYHLENLCNLHECLHSQRVARQVAGRIRSSGPGGGDYLTRAGMYATRYLRVVRGFGVASASRSPSAY